MEPSKIQDVIEWPAPKQLKDVRALVTLCSYFRRFIRNRSRRKMVIYRRNPYNVEQAIAWKVFREDILKLAHTGHLGIRRTQLQVRRRCFWMGWFKGVIRFSLLC